MRRGTLAAGLFIILSSLAAVAEAAGRDQAKEADYVSDIPDQAARFRQATAALDADRWDEAERGFREVLAAHPKHGPTLWRLSTIARVQGRSHEAVELARRSLAARPGWPARDTLIAALVTEEASAGLAEAERLLEEPGAEAPAKERDVWRTQIAYLRNDVTAFRSALEKLQQSDPDGVMTHVYTAIDLVARDSLGPAGEELEKAVAGGYPRALADKIREGSGIRRHEQVFVAAEIGGVVLVVWLSTLLVIFVVGTVLSRSTLGAIERFDGRDSDELRARTGKLRRAYAGVIGFAAVYYFVSIPILIAVVLVGAGGLIYGFILLGRIPIKLVLIVGFVALVSVWSMVKSLVVRRRADEDPGRRLPESEAPALWAVLREVARKVGTRAVDAVYLTVGTDMAVIERGSMSERLRDRGHRALILGVGLLPGFTRAQFRAVLAHEYGHFSNRDTAGGNTGMVVQASLWRSLVGIAQGGGATFFNPAWHFMRGFHRLFLRITLGATRLQEIMADHFAALAYGARAFGEGLVHVVRRSLEFDKTVDALVERAQQQNRPLASLYVAAEGGQATELEAAFKERMSDASGPYDSHPPPARRIEWVSRVPAQPDHAATDDGPVWELFADRAGLEAEMTALANGRLRAQGVIGDASLHPQNLGPPDPPGP